MTLEYFPAKTSINSGVLIVPGGRYKYIGYDTDGKPAAKWLNELGFDAWVLKYSCADNSATPLLRKPMDEAENALGHIRKNYRGKLGAWGWSAGGHLAAIKATEPGLKLDFLILSYPVITMEDANTHIPSRLNLLGETPSPQQIIEMSANKRVTKDMPPTFIFHTASDEAVSVENSLLFAKALNREMIPFAIKIQKDGKHGVGMTDWVDDLKTWLLNIACKQPTVVGELSMADWTTDNDYLQQNHIFE
ncbi:Alpha/Beta hydrolase protein [Nemania serpens]|nr:Alpha/Beta hydrolase protein [Nemania serpens]